MSSNRRPVRGRRRRADPDGPENPSDENAPAAAVPEEPSQEDAEGAVEGSSERNPRRQRVQSPSRRASAAPSSPAVAAEGSDEFAVRLDDDGREISGDEEEGEGDDLNDDAFDDDYKAMPHLDVYEADGLDVDGEYDEMDNEAREAADREIEERRRETLRRQGVDNGLLDISSERSAEGGEEGSSQRGRRRRRIADDDDQNAGEFPSSGQSSQREEEVRVPLEEYNGPIREFLQVESTRREIRRRFATFLREFRPLQRGGADDSAEGELSDEPFYPRKIIDICRDNLASLEVSFLHLSTALQTVTIWLADHPTEILSLFDEVAFEVATAYFPSYGHVQKEIHVRIVKLPIVDSLRDLRQVHLGCLIKVEGVVTRRTSVFPQLRVVKFNCGKCGALLGPYAQQDNGEIQPARCPDCQAKGPFNINSSETIYRNYQKVTLQESPGSVPAGRVPRQKDVILLHDLIDSVSPGELVEITGIYRHQIDSTLNSQNGFPVFQTFILANYVCKQSEAITSMRLTDDDEKEILKWAKRGDIAQIIFNSIGPSIYGHQNIKIALALAMFGGEAKEFKSGHRIRGDLNVLVLGDPGTAKSQFLKYVEKTAPRTVYTTGKGASAVGLTASVHKDIVTREWVLEGGALVLADRGVCLIDEFDKMNDQDRTSIHEAMEQQSISISKAGIITTLKARCSVIAAANPVQGRYNSSATFAENVELSDAILSRFDILCVVRDTVDVATDERLAEFVVNSHLKANPNANQSEGKSSNNPSSSVSSSSLSSPSSSSSSLPVMPQEMLRKYLIYARSQRHPKLSQFDDDKIAKLYADLRRESIVTGGLPIAVRHIESIIRMSEAHARIHLREFVNEEDISMAIRVMLESFISTQKFAVMRALRKQFDKYLTYKKDTQELLLFSLQQLVNEQHQFKLLRLSSKRLQQPEWDSQIRQPIEIPLEDFQSRLNDVTATTLEEFYKSQQFKDNGFSINKTTKCIMKEYQQEMTN